MRITGLTSVCDSINGCGWIGSALQTWQLDTLILTSVSPPKSCRTLMLPADLLRLLFRKRQLDRICQKRQELRLSDRILIRTFPASPSMGCLYIQAMILLETVYVILAAVYSAAFVNITSYCLSVRTIVIIIRDGFLFGERYKWLHTESDEEDNRKNGTSCYELMSWGGFMIWQHTNTVFICDRCYLCLVILAINLILYYIMEAVGA